MPSHFVHARLTDIAATANVVIHEGCVGGDMWLTRSQDQNAGLSSE
jgi:hypothetical protein